MRVEDIKARVSVEDILTHYGSRKDKNGKWRCLFPSNHANGDAHHSVDPYQGRAFCRSQKCFGPKGSDIFEIVGLLESLRNFADQKAWIEKTFGLNDDKPNLANTLRVYKWTDAKGRVAYHLRLDDENKKFTWNQQADGSGAWTLKPCQPDLYQRDQVLAAPNIIVPAGERDCDTMNGWLKDLGKYPAIVATCNHTGENSVRAESFRLLHGKQQVWVIGDNDSTGETYREKVCAYLQGKVEALYSIWVPKEFNDVTEWAEGGGTAQDFQHFLDTAKPAQSMEQGAVSDKAEDAESQNSESEEKTSKKEESQATKLVKLMLDDKCELFHDDEQRAYASMHVREHIETWPLRRKGFKQWLKHRYFIANKKSPSSQAVQDALGVLEGRALYECKEESVYVRVGGTPDEVFLDLGNDDWTMVHITSKGWTVVPHGKVKFRRGSSMKPLPIPIKGGNLEELLKPFLNLNSSDDWKLVIGYLVAAMQPYGSKLIIEADGEQGSGKSTVSDVLKKILDPNKAQKRTPPKDERDLMIGAANNWIMGIDNLSVIQPWLSDAFCRLSTGGALTTRTLYTDEDETLLEAKRPVVINGIGGVSTRPDLLDRAILLKLPQIPEDQRKDEREFWEAFDAVSGQILGAICDAVVCAIRNIKTTRLDTLERMADAVLWVTAAEQALGWKPGSFQRAYRANRGTGNETALESSLIYEPLCQFLTQPHNERWEGRPSELLSALNGSVGEQKTKAKGWPTNPRGLRAALQRIAPNLRMIGIKVEFPDTRTAKGSQVVLELDKERFGHTQHTQPSTQPPENVGCVGPGSQKHKQSFSGSDLELKDEPELLANQLEEETLDPW
jgi:hypothetical protein